MLIGILLLFISGFAQDYFHRQNEAWRVLNRDLITNRLENHYAPGYGKKIKLTVKGIYLSLLIILISFLCRLIIS